MRPIYLLLLAALEAASFAAGPNREQCLTTDAGVVGPVVAEECENLNPVACAAQERNVSDCAGLASLRGFCNEPRVAHHCCQECEEVDGERSGRMAEGVDKTREWKIGGEFEWMVMLKSGGTCSGMLVDEEWVLTAAHCVANDEGAPHGTTVHLAHDETGPTPGWSPDLAGTPLDVPTSSVHVHPRYGERGAPGTCEARWGCTTWADLALLKLPQKARKLRPIALSNNPTTSGISVAGFGADEYHQNAGWNLRTNQARSVNTVGPIVFHSAGYMETHMSSGSHLQADPQTDGSMCGGDSGGAYFITNDCGWPELVGVHTASDSEDCKTGKTNWADNLRHSDFKSWICSTTSNKLAYCTDSGACTPRPDKLEGFAHGTCCTMVVAGINSKMTSCAYCESSDISVSLIGGIKAGDHTGNGCYCETMYVCGAGHSGCSSSCLPGDALVTAIIGEAVPGVVLPISDVPHGAKVLTTGGFSPIYLYGHSDSEAVSPMHRIETDSGHAVELSAQHFIEADDEHILAKDVQAGMRMSLSDSAGALTHVTVSRVMSVMKQGLYSPFTMHGDIVVASRANSSAGIVVSDQSEWFAEGHMPTRFIPALYHALLAPVRALFVLSPAWVGRFHAVTTGATGTIRGKALNEAGAWQVVKDAIASGPWWAD